MITRDKLVEALRLHGPEIREADEWRPLADHVLELVQYGHLDREMSQRERLHAAGVSDEAIKMLRLQRQSTEDDDQDWGEPEAMRFCNLLARDLAAVLKETP